VRSKPGQLSYASGGNGSGPHLAGELFKMVAAVSLVHVPYRGTGPATNDVVAGHVPVMFNGVSASRPHIDAGRLVPLAVASRARNPALPEVPTFGEAGLPAVDISSIWGVLAPARVPEPIQQRLSEAFAAGVRDPALAPRLQSLGYTPVGSTPAEFAAVLRTETQRWAEVIRTANIKPD
jgi:tripartite-type tricarboxylate transporter receptor subunit TctC